MPCDDCKKGFQWNGIPAGKETTLNGANAYITGDSQNTAVLILTDFFGYTLSNIRLLADHYATEVNATVYIPDIFGGESVHPDAMTDPEMRKTFNLGAFLSRNTKEIRWPEIQAAARTLKQQYARVVAVGFCYGGWACFKLAAETSLIDAISVAHPSGLEKSEIENVKVPVQVLAPEHDHEYTELLKMYTFETLAKAAVKWEYIHFPAVGHGFASRGNPADPTQKDAFERAKRSVVHFFNEFAH
ncbi:dienelactone hydrolase family protein [Penicillium chermesinum]|nr:dienelactone hydrolase family protein [Penicillium chermesinum]